jgi:D-3-phosphoglycerate dehydrogenase / 2-oxoglutarate reductase
MPTALLTDADRFPFDTADHATLDAAGVELRELAGHDPADVLDAARGVDAVFVYHARFPRETIERLDGVRVLARCGAGYDNIDVVAAREHGIEVVYVPDYGVDDVADHALALLLACARRVPESDRAIRAGAWPSYTELAPMYRLRGRTLGVIGYGRIGRKVAEKGRAFGLRVVVHDPFVDESVDRDLLLRESDFVSLHMPLTDETRHTIGRAELAMMKPTAVLINTARGGVIDAVALVEALTRGALGGAALDVFEETPLPREHPLRSLDNVVLSPHSAAYTEEALAEVRKRPLADALRILRGETPKDAVP